MEESLDEEDEEETKSVIASDASNGNMHAVLSNEIVDKQAKCDWEAA
jgi:hypothetical protein